MSPPSASVWPALALFEAEVDAKLAELRRQVLDQYRAFSVKVIGSGADDDPAVSLSLHGVQAGLWNVKLGLERHQSEPEMGSSVSSGGPSPKPPRRPILNVPADAPARMAHPPTPATPSTSSSSAGGPPALVREVRRWCEHSSNRLTRELVLLYVLAEESPDTKRMGTTLQFRDQCDTSSPEAALVEEAIERGVRAARAGLLQESVEDRKVRDVDRAQDSVCSIVDCENFNTLLISLQNAGSDCVSVSTGGSGLSKISHQGSQPSVRSPNGERPISPTAAEQKSKRNTAKLNLNFTDIKEILSSGFASPEDSNTERLCVSCRNAFSSEDAYCRKCGRKRS